MPRPNVAISRRP